jgi:hypothetical protein
MELVFALITYLGIQKVDESYFRNIDTCFYFSERINKNMSVPTAEDELRYTAVCQPKKVNIKIVKVY